MCVGTEELKRFFPFPHTHMYYSLDGKSLTVLEKPYNKEIYTGSAQSEVDGKRKLKETTFLGFERRCCHQTCILPILSRDILSYLLGVIYSPRVQHKTLSTRFLVIKDEIRTLEAGLPSSNFLSLSLSLFLVTLLVSSFSYSISCSPSVCVNVCF